MINAWSLACLLSSLFALFPVVLSQSEAACSLGTFRWSFNTKQASPCSVAADLLSVCRPAYVLAPLPDNSHYLGPSIDSADSCQCSTVSYSLVSACAACQNRTITPWSQWASNCAKVSSNVFPLDVPSGTVVPGWAYFDVKERDGFNVALAQENANATESTAVPRPTSQTSSAIPSPTASSTSTNIRNPEAEAVRNSNALGYGIVGGVLGLGIIFAALLAVREHRRRKKAEESILPTTTVPQTEKHSPPAELQALPTLVVHAPPATQLVSSNGSSPMTASFVGSEGSISEKN